MRSARNRVGAGLSVSCIEMEEGRREQLRLRDLPRSSLGDNDIQQVAITNVCKER